MAAAANLQKVFTEALIAGLHEENRRRRPPTYGATKALAAQIENGAPIDVFVAADTATVQKLAARRLLVASTVHPYAIGQLVAVVQRKDAAHHPRRLEDLADPVMRKSPSPTRKPRLTALPRSRHSRGPG